MADVIKEYAIQISVQGSKAVIKEFKELNAQETKQNKKLKETNSLLWTYAKRLVSIYAIYKLFRKGFDLGTSFAEQGNNLKNLATSANISTKALQKWGYLVKKYGGNEQNVAQTMGNLQSKLYNWHNFGDTSAFQTYMERFGDFPMADNAEDFLLEVADKLKGLSGDEQNAILDSLSITDNALRLLLKEGNVEEKLKGAKVLFTDEQIKKAERVKELMIDFNHELAKLNIALGELFLPTMIRLMKRIQDFLRNPKQFVIESMKETYNNSPLGILWNTEIEAGKRVIGFAKNKYEEGKDFVGERLDNAKNWIDKQYRLAEFKRDIANISVYNDNAININGANTPETIAEKVAGNIVGISDHSLTLAGLSFATKRKS